MSAQHYYELLADPEEVSRWYLKSPLDADGNEVNPRIFTQGIQVDFQQQLVLPLRRSGKEVDFNFSDFDMVVTPSSLNSELEALLGSVIQRIPVEIENSSKRYEILNVSQLVECLDESRSLFTKWAAGDGRPEKIGQYRMIATLKIDPAAVKGRHLFRVAGWPISMIVSEEVKKFLESRKTSGLKYERVD